jgi:tetratricopeptide (TPR) repeat protein
MDPNGARTVASQTADADGPADILPAMDRLLRGVRARLGESLPQIQSTTQPLERVTTPNLEALRALARGAQLQREGDLAQSVKLFKYATEIDPDFATAYARMGAVLFAEEKYPDARAALERSLTFEGRLTERERIYVRALLACYVDPKAMLDAWRMYVELYPSVATGHNNLGNVNYYFLQDYHAAELAYERAVALPSPLKYSTAQQLAHVLLAQEKVVDAEQQFRSARALAPPEVFFGFADALVAGGKLEEAARYLDEAKQQPNYFEVERGMRRATLLVARGDIDNAVVAIQASLGNAEKLTTPNARWRAQNAMIALLTARSELDRARDLSGRVLSETLLIAARPDANLEAIEQMLYAASWAARLGLTDQARKGLTFAKQSGSLDRFPIRARLATLVEAELELKAGHAEAAIERLQGPVPEPGLWEAHELRVRAFRALGDRAPEQTELKWLVAHRGLAHAQWTDGLLGQQARVLALRDAELQLSNYDLRPKDLNTGAPGR